MMNQFHVPEGLEYLPEVFPIEMMLVLVIAELMAQRVIIVFVGLIEYEVPALFQDPDPFFQCGFRVLYFFKEMAGINIIKLLIPVIIQYLSFSIHVSHGVVKVYSYGIRLDLGHATTQIQTLALTVFQESFPTVVGLAIQFWIAHDYPRMK